MDVLNLVRQMDVEFAVCLSEITAELKHVPAFYPGCSWLFEIEVGKTPGNPQDMT
ncbi:MAG: hypothetical protein M1442_03105 [Candidatus Thermoplasmatota archaeon]|jgi:hypothetical protein|nr:hypothetical protein [Candidatus Thermoplasmatota archaeon]